MSFPQHPFRHISLVDLEDNGIYYWRCDGCGADGKRAKDPLPFTSASSDLVMSKIIRQYHTHVRNSHELTPEDVKD